MVYDQLRIEGRFDGKIQDNSGLSKIFSKRLNPTPSGDMQVN